MSVNWNLGAYLQKYSLLRAEFQQSIKGADTEEKLDLYFYRPCGFIFAKMAQYFCLTPTQVTILGMILGVIAGFFYLYNESFPMLLTGTILFIFSGILDSADGQLARLTQCFSPIGLVLDGLCDNLVMMSVYLCSCCTVFSLYGYWIFLIAVMAGFSHSLQSSILDFYNREYLYFGHGKIGMDYWNPTITEAKQIGKDKRLSPLERRMNRLRFTWVWQQNMVSGRSDEERYLLRTLCASDKGQKIYRDHNRLMIRVWRLMGTNFHTLMIILFVFLQRFDLYLIFIDILCLNIILLILRAIQKIQDRKLLRALAVVCNT